MNSDGIRMRALSFCLLTLATQAFAQAPEAQSGPDRPSAIGYATVAEALAALKAKPGVQVETTKPDGWTIINEPDHVQWSFTPNAHSAYPAVVRRAIKQNADGGIAIETSALCQAEKAPCDKLVAEFAELNERIRQAVQKQLKASN
jgi:hypothetical protein